MITYAKNMNSLGTNIFKGIYGNKKNPYAAIAIHETILKRCDQMLSYYPNHGENRRKIFDAMAKASYKLTNEYKGIKDYQKATSNEENFHKFSCMENANWARLGNEKDCK